MKNKAIKNKINNLSYFIIELLYTILTRNFV